MATLPLALSIETTANLLCNTLNSSVIFSSLNLNMFLLFFVVSLVERWLIFSSVADITAFFYSGNDGPPKLNI